MMSEWMCKYLILIAIFACGKTRGNIFFECVGERGEKLLYATQSRIAHSFIRSPFCLLHRRRCSMYSLSMYFVKSIFLSLLKGEKLFK